MFDRTKDAREMREEWLRGMTQFGMNCCHGVNKEGAEIKVQFESFFRRDLFFLYNTDEDVQYFVEPHGIPKNIPDSFREMFIKEIKENEEAVLRNIHFLYLYEQEALWRSVPYPLMEAIEALEALLAAYNHNEAIALFNRADFGYKL